MSCFGLLRQSPERSQQLYTFTLGASRRIKFACCESWGIRSRHGSAGRCDPCHDALVVNPSIANLAARLILTWASCADPSRTHTPQTRDSTVFCNALYRAGQAVRAEKSRLATPAGGWLAAMTDGLGLAASMVPLLPPHHTAVQAVPVVSYGRRSTTAHANLVFGQCVKSSVRH